MAQESQHKWPGYDTGTGQSLSGTECGLRDFLPDLASLDPMEFSPESVCLLQCDRAQGRGPAGEVIKENWRLAAPARPLANLGTRTHNLRRKESEEAALEPEPLTTKPWV